MSRHPPRALLSLFTLCLALLHGPAVAQENPMHAGALAHALDRVAHTGRVLYIAAHPDDENTRLLGYLANGRHLTVAYLSLTRGEGGQNLIGSEKGELLGVIRTQELLAARRVDGAQQRFTSLRDFGYSKSAEETLAHWGHEEALADVVWVIRRFQPDVVITRFNERPPNHGHHTASAILAREAVEAAADPNRFPEQLYLQMKPWRVDRLLHNVSTWRDKPPPDALAVDVGGYDARLGLSYGDLAARSRTQHKSQGFGSSGERGPLLEHFTHLAGTKPQGDLLSGLELTWRRYGEAATPLIQALDDARRTLGRDTPEQALPALLDAHRALDALPEDPRTLEARRGLDAVITSAVGLFVRATANAPAVAPGGSLPVEVELVLGRPTPVLQRIVLQFPDHSEQVLPAVPRVNERLKLSREVPVSDQAAVSAPYWLKVPSADGRHVVEERWLLGNPESPPPLQVQVSLMLEGRVFAFYTPVLHVWTDPVHGERSRRVLITPPATVTPLRDAVMLSNGKAGQVTLRVRGSSAKVEGAVRLPVPEGWKVTPAEHPLKLEKAGEETLVQFDVVAPAGAGAVSLEPQVVVAGTPWSWREDVIDHPHIPMQVVLQPATVRAVPLSIKLPRGLVGYVEGSGDSVREDLAHVGVRTESVDVRTLRTGDLSRFSALVFGVRAF
ncbi:MAG TPA: PIG-L family deacetylase, partial [Longimicrobium sp.]|nr:PIG-L family deacetylase [Longimicrobium sp.]